MEKGTTRGYGFFLRDDEGIHVIEQVEDDGVAAKAGLKNGDYVLEINGHNVENEDHDQVKVVYNYKTRTPLHQLVTTNVM